jgi:hypothetical protein
MGYAGMVLSRMRMLAAGGRMAAFNGLFRVAGGGDACAAACAAICAALCAGPDAARAQGPIASAAEVGSGFNAGIGAGRSASSDSNANSAGALSRNILVDQFGYRPKDPKVAVIRSAQAGFDAGDGFKPGMRYEVRRVDDGTTVFTGAPVAWEAGAVEASSGDRGWWFDFSALAQPGRYVVVDVERHQRSPAFDIDPQVYAGALKAAMRMYFYQRSGFAKRPPYAQACWTDAAAYLGPGQDTEARDISDRDNPGKRRDLSGGWFDAGDTNKYVPNAVQPVHQLLDAYRDNPEAFGDDFDIPESGNGIPDLIDEVKWETDWLKKMQYPDGSVALKVGEIVYAPASPPSSDRNARYYVPACTSSTIAAAGMFAHASYAYARFAALAADAQDLKARAISAWKRFRAAGALQTDCDSGEVHAGRADVAADDQNAAAAEAAIYLFAITGDAVYHDYLKAHYRDMKPYRDEGWSRYDPDQGEALLFYTTLAGADPALARSIRADKLKDALGASHIYRFDPHEDLYRAFLLDGQYHWGSNNPRANYGNTNLDVVRYRLAPADPEPYRRRALEILHYFHGVNPLGIVYLSNVGALGATRSVDEIFHAWFLADTRWSDAKTSACGPAPGYVPGGPNANAERDGVPARIAPPAGQPPQKSYKDWNASTPENSWVINEPAIYYQAAYVKLLSAFAR